MKSTIRPLPCLLAIAVAGAAGLQASTPPPPGQNAITPCGNPNTKPSTDPPCESGRCPKEGESDCPDQGGDPINLRSGDFFQNVTDLRVYGSVGGAPLAWGRHAHTRETSGLHAFGQGPVRHSYQWEIADAGVDANGNALLTIHHPDGASRTYTKTGSAWSTVAGTPYTLTQNGNDFHLQMADGVVYHFQKLTDADTGAVFYQMQDFRDAAQNLYTFTYSAPGSNQLTRVTDPSGRSLRITWGVQTFSSSQKLAELTATPAAGWNELTLSAPGAYRHLWYRSADGGYGNVSEVEFCDASGNKLTGTPFGTAPFWQNNPAYSFTKVFDNDTSTFYNTAAGMGSGGIAGLDLGASATTPVAKIRFFPRPNYAGRMVNFGGYGYAKNACGAFFGAADAPVSTPVITAVTSHDAAGNQTDAVQYTYAAIADRDIPGFGFVMLSTVDYSDSTQATFAYSQLYSGARPLVSSYVEPRYGQPLVRAALAYNTNAVNALGTIWQQRNPDNGEPLTTFGTVAGGQGGAYHNSGLWFANGGMMQISAPWGGNTSFSYDPEGNQTTYWYTSSGTGFRNKVQDSLGNITSYTLTARGNTLQTTNPDNTKVIYTRDALDLVLTEKDELGRTTTYTRDASHRVTQITHPDGLTEVFTYNGYGQVLTHTRRDGSVVSNAYDATGRKTSSTDALGQATTYTYDSLDRLATVTDPLGHTTSYQYNPRGQVTQVTYPDGTAATATYDTYGNTLASTDEMGHTTTRTYDWYKRLKTQSDPLGRTTTYDYSLNLGGGGGCGCAYIESSPSSVTSPSGSVTYFTYDLDWKKTSATAGFGTAHAATTNYQYDSLGRLVSTMDPLGHIWSTSYDNRGRKATQTDPLGQTTGYTYDTTGNLLTTTLPDGRVTANTYDTLGRLATAMDPLNQVTAYGYDAMGRQNTLTDTKGNVTTWTYDARGSLTGKTYANGNHHAYTYDAAGRMHTHTTPKGDICTFGYDPRGRQTLADWNTSTPDTTRSYNACGQPLSISSGASTLTYTYDAAHQLLTETQSLAGFPDLTVGHTYDADGQPATTTYPSGKVVSYAWTPRHQLASVSNDGPPPLATYSCDASGNLLALAHENGVTETKTHDAANRLLSTVQSASAGTLSGHSYTLDATGRRTAETFGDGSTPARSYGYDATDQVTGATYGSGQSDSYAYDAMGNRTSATLARNAGATTAYTSNAANQYTALTGSAAPTYDPNGNLLTANGVTYTWDSQDRLLTASDGAATLAYTYDPLGRRTTKTAATAVTTMTTRYALDGWNVIEEYQGGAGATLALAKTHTWSADLSGALQGAGGVGGLLLTETPAGGTHFHYDGNGNVTTLTGATGTVTASLERPPRKLDREYERRTDLPAGERPARMGPAQARRSRARAGWICPPHSANPQPNTRT